MTRTEEMADIERQAKTASPHERVTLATRYNELKSDETEERGFITVHGHAIHIADKDQVKPETAPAHRKSAELNETAAKAHDLVVKSPTPENMRAAYAASKVAHYAYPLFTGGPSALGVEADAAGFAHSNAIYADDRTAYDAPTKIKVAKAAAKKHRLAAAIHSAYADYHQGGEEEKT